VDPDIAIVASLLVSAKQEFEKLVAFKARAEPLLAQLEDLLAERARLKGLLEQCASQEVLAEALRN
jgi:hypothetical protein